MIASFYKVLETGDYKHIGKDFKESDWLKLYDEYFKEAELKMPDWKVMRRFNNAYLKFYAVASLLPVLASKDSNFNECKKVLKRFKYKYDEKTSLKDNLTRFEKNINVLETKIKIMQDDLPKEGEKVNLWKELIQLKKHFKFDIDPQKTTCREWIELKKQLKEDVRSS